MCCVLVIAHGMLGLHCSMRTLSCGMFNLVPQPRIEPWSPALGTLSLSHWTNREVPPATLNAVKVYLTLLIV